MSQTYLARRIDTAVKENDFAAFTHWSALAMRMASPDNFGRVWDINVDDGADTGQKTLGDHLIELAGALSTNLTKLHEELKVARMNVADTWAKISDLEREAKDTKLPIDEEKLNSLKNALKKHTSNIEKLEKKYRKQVRPVQDANQLLYEMHLANKPGANQSGLTKNTQVARVIASGKKWYDWFIEKCLKWFGIIPRTTVPYRLNISQYEKIIANFPALPGKVEMASEAPGNTPSHRPPLNMNATYLWQTPQPTSFDGVDEGKVTPVDDTQTMGMVQVYKETLRQTVQTVEEKTELNRMQIREALAKDIDVDLASLEVDKSTYTRSNYLRYSADDKIKNLITIEGSRLLLPQLSDAYVTFTMQDKTKRTIAPSKYTQMVFSFSENAMTALMEIPEVGTDNFSLLRFDPATQKFVLPPGLFYKLEHNVDRGGVSLMIFHIGYNEALKNVLENHAAEKRALANAASAREDWARFEREKEYKSCDKTERAWVYHLIGQAPLSTLVRDVRRLKSIADKKLIKLPEPPTTMDYKSLAAYINTLHFSAAPRQQLSINFDDWNNITDYALLMLRSGYSLIHNDMQLDWDAHLDLTNALIGRGPHLRFCNPLFIGVRSLVSQNFTTLPRSENGSDFFKDNKALRLRYFTTLPRSEDRSDFFKNNKALWLRYLSLNKDPRYFKAALAKWDTLQNATFTDVRDREIEQLSCWKQACLFALLLPPNTQSALSDDEINLDLPPELNDFPVSTKAKLDARWDLKTNEIAISTIETLERGLKRVTVDEENTPKNMACLYTEAEIKEALELLSLEDSGAGIEDNPKAKLLADMQHLNALAVKCNELEPDALYQKLQTLKDPMPMLEKLAVLIIAYERKTKKLLRLEQALSILIAMRANTLFEIKTSEGKTTIILFNAILKALSPKESGSNLRQKVDVITHNEFLAEEGAIAASVLAPLCGLTVVDMNAPANDVLEADILYTVFSRAVFNKMLADTAEEKTHARDADSAIVDECDQVLVDIAMVDMELPNTDPTLRKTIDTPKLIALAEKLATFAHDKQTTADSLMEEKSFRALIPSLSFSHEEMHFWLRALLAAEKLKPKEDFVNNEDIPGKKQIQIVHKSTHGRRDPHSIWGRGVHQAVTVWEIYRKQQTDRLGNPPIDEWIMPDLTPVLAQQSVGAYLQTYPKGCIGVTGTAGEEKENAFIDYLRQSLTPASHSPIPLVRLARAKRPHIPEHKWPRVPKDSQTEHKDERIKTKEDTKPLRHRRYDFDVTLCPGKKAHYEALLAAVRNAQLQNLSCLLFLDTIIECERFHEYLSLNGVSVQRMQVYDDAGSQHSRIPRLAENVLIEEASRPGMLTIASPAAGRGIDFKRVDVAIAAKPGLARIFEQELARVARDGALGITQVILNQNDLGLADNYARGEHGDCRTNKEILQQWMQEKQSTQLACVIQKSKAASARDKFQRAFFQQLRADQSIGNPEKQALKALWSKFLLTFEEEGTMVDEKDAASIYSRLKSKQP